MLEHLPLVGPLHVASGGFAGPILLLLAGIYVYYTVLGKKLKTSVSSEASEKLVVPLPKKWVKTGNIQSLIIYPIKSCKGIYLDSAVASKLGLRGDLHSKAFRDRVFLVVNSKGREMVQKNFPKMVLLEPHVDAQKEEMTLNAPGMESITFRIPKLGSSNVRTVHIMNDKNLTALDCGDCVAAWLDEYLEKPGMRLVFHIEGKTREQRNLTQEQLVYPTFAKSDIGVFQNESSYLLVNDDSVTELNKHLDGKIVDHRNFRPTVLVANTPGAYKELKWNYVKVGDGPNATILKNGRPCDRCPIVTNDQETAEFDKDKEPLKTLRSFVLDHISPAASADMKGRPVMGLRMGLVGDHEDRRVSVGDPIYVEAV